MKAVLIRLTHLSNHLQTCGRFLLLDNSGNVVFQAACLELPWRDNRRNISSIPDGSYKVTKTDSPKFGKGSFLVNYVPGRSHIRIHQGNYTRDIEGCILLGDRFGDIDNDGITDVVNSKATIKRLQKLADSFDLSIIQI